MKRAASTLLALLLAVFAFIPAARAASPDVAASGVCLMEGNTGRVLYEKNADARLPMASTTKIMTALLAIESGRLDEIVTVPDEAYGTEGSSMYLNRGEKISLRDLVYGLMFRSGNDAAVAIACHIAGSQSAFAERMNARAGEMGLADTHFVTPNGLHDENHYTSARDLTRLGAEAMKNPTFYEIVSSSYHETASGDQARTLKNKNRLLWEYAGGCGVKTGFTKAAGKCLVFAAKRGETLLIGTLLDCPDMWNAAYALLDFGFDGYQTKLLVDPALPLSVLPVHGGIKKTLEVYPKQAILYTLRTDGSETPSFSVSLPDALEAPVRAGDNVGEITLYVDGKQVQTTGLIVSAGTPAADVRHYFRMLIEALSA